MNWTKGGDAMRFLIVCGILGLSTLVDVSASFASEGPWCLRTRSRVTDDCSIPSQQMCNFVALPENGSCWPNPRFRAVVAPNAPRRSARRVQRRDY
jgi:hypothetical protein